MPMQHNPARCECGSTIQPNAVQVRPAALRIACVALTLTALSVLSGCGQGGAIGWDLDPDVQRPRTGVVIFLVDGLPPRMVEQGCREGWLPNIQARLWERGSHVDRATTCVPAITYASITTLLTGTGPGEHEIVGNRWFDPDKLIFRDYATIRHYRDVNDDFDEATLYELISPAQSLSVQAAHHRGVTKNIANWAQSGRAVVFPRLHGRGQVDRHDIGRRGALGPTQGRVGRRHLCCIFRGPIRWDTHMVPAQRSFREALEGVDYQMGRVCDWLERQELLETNLPCAGERSRHGRC